MDIYINAVKADFTLENEKTIGEILNAVEADCEKNNATIIRVSIDDKNISGEKLDAVFGYTIESVKKLEIETVAENDIMLALHDVSEKFTHIRTELLQVPILLQSSKDAKVSAIVTLFADQFDVMCHLLTLCSLFPARFEGFSIDGQSISNFLTNFTPILQEFETSFSSHDTVLTGDLAEYEIAPRLEAFSTSVTNLWNTKC